ncbi:MAG: hypothetical protein DRJ32_02050 [Thermoprotei archaeon]|nr:MAG: hypothetical protein DRJ32_02050 [Thermoprotei archaeon]
MKSYYKIFLVIVIPFLIRLFTWCFLSRIIPLSNYDTFVYLPVGSRYIKGILDHDVSVLLLNCEHPPLAKLLIGLSIYLFGFTNSFNASVLLHAMISSIIAYFIYLMGAKNSERKGLLSWVLFTFDPFSIHWTISWLDIPMLMYMTIGIYLLYYTDNKHRYVPAGVMFGLAFLCKYTSILILFIFIMLSHLFKVINIRYSLKAIAIGLIILLFNPQFWVGGATFAEVVAKNRKVGNLSYPIISFPLFNNLSFFWIPSYIWCFSSCNSHVLPLVTPLICFIAFIYKKVLRGSVGVDYKALLWLSASLITLSILPKHYVYYNIVLIPPLALITSEAILNSRKARIGILKRIVFIPASYMIALSPLQLIISIMFPTGWWFLWDVMRNPHVMGCYSIIAFIISVIAFTWGILFAFIFL